MCLKDGRPLDSRTNAPLLPSDWSVGGSAPAVSASLPLLINSRLPFVFQA